ncbi:DNA-directed RNA polymerase subunit [Mycena indigotica]|uniref:DNA-directed RNA polymerase n=1 Tax=Mycena indigotica TaxID=2126181 RepID=A0A8H6S7D0_9AGAR|nr:DNA-directed RNA polymerase subunit [Mycena indigotica]KAF7293441.1 DNA-directed RNA polymerase subunit [Mycena indigotica]
MPYSTFHLNLSVTPPYNADFDGDEMNMHVPQSEETWAELSQMAWVPRQIVSPQANKPVMGIVQDTLCGICKFLIGTDKYQLLQSSSPNLPGPASRFLVWSFLTASPSCGAEDKSNNPVFDDGMLIENGEIIFGTVEKQTSGTSQGGFVHVVFREKGPEATRQLSTVSVLATLLPKIVECKTNVMNIIEHATHDRLKAALGMTIRESFESLVERQLNLAPDDSGQFAQKDWKEERCQADGGGSSKGSFINILQTSHRTLPHFTKDDFSPEARGFVENSYLRGLTPQEFFFHAMAGREGLIDTAVKTAEMGYIQRRLVKALEDAMVSYDGTVQNSLGDLIQFIYGEDGMDGAFIEKQDIATFAMNDEQFRHDYRVDVTDEKGGFMPGVLQLGLDDSSLELLVQAKLDEEYTQLSDDRNLLRTFIFPRAGNTTNFYLPVNMQRIIQNATQIFRIDRRQPSDLEPAYILDAVRELGERLVVVRGNDPISTIANGDAWEMLSCDSKCTFGQPLQHVMSSNGSISLEKRSIGCWVK